MEQTTCWVLTEYEMNYDDELPQKQSKLWLMGGQSYLKE